MEKINSKSISEMQKTGISSEEIKKWDNPYSREIVDKFEKTLEEEKLNNKIKALKSSLIQRPLRLHAESALGVGSASLITATAITFNPLIGIIAGAVGSCIGFAMGSFLNIPIKDMFGIKSKENINLYKPDFKTESYAESKLLSDKVQNELDKKTHSKLIEGNNVEILVNGINSFKKRYELMENAKRSIDLQTFIYSDDETGWKTAKLLAEKVKQGVKCRLIYDEFVSSKNQKIFDFLTENGVEVIRFNPKEKMENEPKHKIDKMSNLFFQRYAHRWHQKILCVDDASAIVGGMNISSEYANSGTEKIDLSLGAMAGSSKWMRDTDVLIEGPVAQKAAENFAKNWKYAGGKDPRKIEYENDLTKKMGDISCRYLSHYSFEEKDKNILNYYKIMFKNCEKTAYITNPYFIPDEEMMDLMADAVKRGVDVRVLTNSDKINDMEIATHAGRLNYKRLLNDGIRIYEMQPHESGHRRTLHSKIAVFDGVCSTIGSSNIDNLSFGINSENNAVFFDPGKGREMNEVFIKDCSMAKEFTLDTLKEFSFGDYAEQYIYNKFFKKIL